MKLALPCSWHIQRVQGAAALAAVSKGVPPPVEKLQAVMEQPSQHLNNGSEGVRPTTWYSTASFSGRTAALSLREAAWRAPASMVSAHPPLLTLPHRPPEVPASAATGEMGLCANPYP